MHYGPEFASAFREAIKTPEYWMEEVRLDFLKELESILEKRNITQSSLAKKIGKSEAYISKIINSNISNFTLRTMVQLALAVDAKVSLKIKDIEPVSFAKWKDAFPIKKEYVYWNNNLNDENNMLQSNIPMMGAENDGCQNKDWPIAV